MVLTGSWKWLCLGLNFWDVRTRILTFLGRFPRICRRNIVQLPGHTATGGGSIPPEICITVQKPDIVIIDKFNKCMHLFENTEKRHKYAHFVTVCPSGEIKCTLACFEVSSRGMLTPRNSNHLHTSISLHKEALNYHCSRKISLYRAFCILSTYGSAGATIFS